MVLLLLLLLPLLLLLSSLLSLRLGGSDYSVVGAGGGRGGGGAVGALRLFFLGPEAAVRSLAGLSGLRLQSSPRNSNMSTPAGVLSSTISVHRLSSHILSLLSCLTPLTQGPGLGIRLPSRHGAGSCTQANKNITYPSDELLLPMLATPSSSTDPLCNLLRKVPQPRWRGAPWQRPRKHGPQQSS